MNAGALLKTLPIAINLECMHGTWRILSASSAGYGRVREARGEQRDHHWIVAVHVARHEMKFLSELLGRLLFGAQSIILCATRAIGMKHRVKFSAIVRLNKFPD